ncbi:transcriptional regulator, AraC family [Solidesulfovibrio fructosivorans JJ]]|uniref:Transcriptional regulator, AraC family n=1 Tax=Solidesulfovibrio fructosivorans JJ] TaxID=596151 RepID=E1K2B9_SOLFR|nr:AraC family transcriptional regulator [Solidesulfovibrio fructosivorans]EFL49239.1 transcriptional regulator, AraC family [Solidesulfovibrio fructosivorans JJ]]
MPQSALSVSRHPGAPGLEAVCGVGVAADIVRHAHARSIVGLCLGGGRRITAGGGVFEAGPGQGFVIPPGVVHACAPAGDAGHSYVALAASAACFPPGRGDGEAAVEVWPRLWRDRQAAELLLATAAAVSSGDGRALRFFQALAARLDLRPASPPPLHAATRRAKAAIDAAPAEPVTVAGLAGLAGVSPYHLERLFRRDLGVPLLDYALSRRVALAALRIGEGEEICEAALAAGFCDQSHLSRQFRRRMGVPPGRYRVSRPS